MNRKIIYLVFSLFVITACSDLDLNPLSEGSSENWYSNETEIQMALNDIYRSAFWPLDGEDWTDNWTKRNGTTPITDGTINSEWGTSKDRWGLSYKAIARANTILGSLERAANAVPEAKLKQFEAAAKFVRAAHYGYLVTHFGDVVFFTKVLDLEESFTLGRTDKNTIMEAVYADFDFAIENLPESYSNSENKLATKGAAMAYKARIALYMGDYQLARDAAKACMDLDVYELYPDFDELFLSSTKNSSEEILGFPRSTELGSSLGTANYISRTAGGWGQSDPSWDLLCAFLCTDGLPIDESPLYDPHNPFNNRDPRCAGTIVEFGTPHLGFIYQPHPDSLQVLNLKTGNYQYNHDTRTNKFYASFNGLLWKKGVDEDWSDDKKAENTKILMRYADVLLMYAEAKIELNEIDQTVLDAINKVRARAYKVDVGAVSDYPAVTTISQDELRKQLRIERRMEFAWEGTRYMDIIRWRIAENVLTKDIYGLVDEAKDKLVDANLWFFPATPEIDEDGAPDFTPMYNDGLVKLLAVRDFDASRQYLWPIPAKEILINENLTQNPGY
ncbi:RagB/SusD family nutrient uptake outer membrane protein [Prolixibacteraceae bacterium JC049]|nr:RagB/SusD family nutrient uptake outer membrane protein [Prolixibacteraceae bacterium JC049]